MKLACFWPKVKKPSSLDAGAQDGVYLQHSLLKKAALDKYDAVVGELAAHANITAKVDSTHQVRSFFHTCQYPCQRLPGHLRGAFEECAGAVPTVPATTSLGCTRYSLRS